MTGALRDTPFFRLTAHFFHALFDLGVLNEDGADAVVRVILGSVAIILSLGLLLTRMFMGKYAALSLLFRSEGGPALYRSAILADNSMVLALSMWIAAVVTVLVSHSLFPDETDFRILMPLPIRRRLVFGCKLAALTLFCGLFVATTLMALGPIMLMMSVGRYAGHRVVPQLLAYAGAGVAASAFVVFGIAALTGLAMIGLPRSRVRGGLTVIRSVMLCGLVLEVPFVFRTPALGSEILGEARWLYLAPPAWFMGLERWLLGERMPFLTRLAEIAVSALASAAILAFASYAVMYARFDRIMVRSFAPSHWSLAWPSQWPRLRSRPPAFTAIVDFTMAALRRSAIHQGIVLALSACGVAIAVNSLGGEDVFRAISASGPPSRTVLYKLTWATSAVVFAGTLAVRSALVVPIEPRANWLFRMTEYDEARAAQLSGVVHVMRWIGVGVPIALMVPLHLLVLGPSGLTTLGVAALCGLLLVEIHLRDWRRIPFTCSYLPGKHAVTNSALLGFVAFLAYTGLTAVLAGAGYARPSRGLFAIVLLGVIVVIARRHRLAKWNVIPLLFEDLLPAAIQPLGLPRD